MSYYNTIKDVNSFLSDIGYLKEYLRVYDEKDIVLFNSRAKAPLNILSNFWQSSVSLPWRGQYFHCVESIIIYSYISDNLNILEIQEQKEIILNMLLDCKDGREVKKNNKIQTLYRYTKELARAQMGEENYALYSWKIACDAISVKYKFCPEFKELVNELGRNKYFVENSYWRQIPFAGALKVTDVKSQYYGKYIGVNSTGVAIQRCVML